MNNIDSETPKTPEEIVDEFLEQFNDDFKTSVELSENEYPFLNRMFDYYLQEFSTTPLYKKVVSQICILEDEIQKKYSQEDIILFEKWNALIDRMHNEDIKAMYFGGYFTAKQLEKEEHKK